MFLKPLFFSLTTCLLISLLVFVVSVGYTSHDIDTILRHALYAFVLGSALFGFVALVLRSPASVYLLLVSVVAIILAAPAQAEVTPTSGVVLPYGQWISEYLPAVLTIVVPWIAGVITWALAKWAPWATSVATQARIEAAAQALAQYAVKAVPNSVKDGKVTVDLGSTVLATAVQRGVNVLPSRVLKAMEKGGGITPIIFRTLDLEPAASEANVLKPAEAALKANGTIR